MEPKEFRTALEARDVEFAAPVSEPELEWFESLLGGRMDPYFRKLYSEFNGYSHDNDTHIDLWSLERIAKHLTLSETMEDGRFFAFGDFLADSDLLMVNLHNSNSRVFLQGEKRVLASNISELLAGLASGKFDFPKAKPGDRA